MVAILTYLLAAAAVPNVTAGPNLSQEAKAIEAPLNHVTVYSDRARIRRKARVDLTPGTHTFSLPDLPGAVMMNTVRVSCPGAKVLRIETMPIERERFSIDQVEELIDQLEKLTDQLTAVDEKSSVINQELIMLAGVAPRAAVDESKRVGKSLPPVLPEMWKKVLDFLQRRKDSCRTALQKNAIARRQLAEKLTKVQREIQRRNLGAFTDRKIQVLVIVKAAKSFKAKLELEYFVPGASWTPAYDIHFHKNLGNVMIKTGGMVHQATGEDWTDVKLDLSTAIPGQGIDFPELLTWALGEKREFIPRPRAARMPQVAPLFPPPQRQPIVLESERAARLQVIRQRISHLQALARTNFGSLDLSGKLIADGLIRDSKDLSGVGGHGSLGTIGYGKGAGLGSLSGGSVRPGSSRPSSRRKKSYAPKPVMAPPPPPRPPSRTAPPPMDAVIDRVAVSESVSTVSKKKSGSSSRVIPTSLGLFDSGGYRAPHFSNRNLPAVLAGGLDYVYSSQTRVSVPSTGKKLRVPLASQSYPVQTFYQATPSLKKTAYLKATVTNRSGKPILQGPANIFVGNDFSGQGRLKTTGSGGTIELPLGADEDIRILHKIVPETVSEGVFSKDDVTTYVTVIELGNYKKRAIHIQIFDQLLKTSNEDIEIELLKVTPKQTKGPDASGIMQWEVDIPAGKTKTIEFRYKVTRPENWQLTQ